MDIRATLALVIDSLNSSIDRDRVICQRNIPHLQTAQFTNPHTGHQRAPAAPLLWQSCPSSNKSPCILLENVYNHWSRVSALLQYGLVAQLGERTVRIRKVEGSIPFESTITDTAVDTIVSTAVSFSLYGKWLK